MTVKEIAQEYALDESTVREAAKKRLGSRAQVRRNLAIRSHDAHARWGERPRG